MKRFSLPLLSVLVLSMVLPGCGTGSKSDLMQLIAERDSLRFAAEVQTQKLMNIEKAVNMMNATMDSIAREEEMIFVNTNQKDGMPITRQDALSNLERYEEMMLRQHKKIVELQEELKRNVFNAEAQRLIENLQAQVATKDRQIAELRQELEKKDANIAQLREQVRTQSIRIDQQTETITALNTQNQRQGEALKKQDEFINTGYVLIGSKDDLKRKGVLDNKGKLNPTSLLDKSKFAKIDMRTWKEITFSCNKAPKILTTMPESSFSLYKTGDEFRLVINNPSDFWRLSSYLVIQTN
ncbi:MAG: hypothetical protein LIP03_02095 [Bacteroidales bacterium]|nr:hypothetical protein [Bacteroidales bacterium]